MMERDLHVWRTVGEKVSTWQDAFHFILSIPKDWNLSPLDKDTEGQKGGITV